MSSITLTFKNESITPELRQTISEFVLRLAGAAGGIGVEFVPSAAPLGPRRSETTHSGNGHGEHPAARPDTSNPAGKRRAGKRGWSPEQHRKYHETKARKRAEQAARVGQPAQPPDRPKAAAAGHSASVGGGYSPGLNQMSVLARLRRDSPQVAPIAREASA